MSPNQCSKFPDNYIRVNEAHDRLPLLDPSLFKRVVSCGNVLYQASQEVPIFENAEVSLEGKVVKNVNSAGTIEGNFVFVEVNKLGTFASMVDRELVQDYILK